MEELNEAHAALRHAPGQQAVGCISPRLARVWTVEFESARRFLGEVGKFGHGTLHLVGHLILRDAGRNLRVAEVIHFYLVQPRHVVDEPAARFHAEAGWVGEIQHRVAERAEFYSLIPGRQKTAAPMPIRQRLIVWIAAALRDHHDESRQIAVLAPQTVGEPCADRGTARKLEARLKESDGWIVI